MNNIYLSHFQASSRIPSRREDQRQPDFDDNFEYDLFAYDFFISNGKTYLICPPSPNEVWTSFFSYAKFDGLSLSEIKFELFKNKIDKLIIHAEVREVSLGNNIINSRRASNITDYKKVLYTLQKNNSLEWIRDWAAWYVVKHQVDCIIIYDNHSSDYSVSQICDALASLNVHTIIQSVPFKYGPGAFNGSSWDSDFLQYAMFEHVRYMYCQNAEGLINSDIDELVYVRENKSIFSLISAPATGVMFYGKWVDLADSDIEFKGSHINHQAHDLLDFKSLCPTKWAVNLVNLPDKVFLRVHEISALKCLKIAVSEVLYLHHRCISTNWKTKRLPVISVDNDKFCRLSGGEMHKMELIHAT